MPIYETRGSTAEVVDARDGTATLGDRLARDLGAGGGTLLAYDEFDRYADGALNGQVPIIGPAWVVTGASPITIQGGKATANGTSTGYALLTFTEPAHYLECVMTFSGTDDGSKEMTMAWTESASLQDLLHLNFGGTGLTLTIRKDGGAFLPLGTAPWREKCVYDGTTQYKFGVFVRNESLTVIGPHGEMFSVNDPRIASLAANLTAFWEPIAGGTGRASLMSVRAVARPDAVVDIEQGSGLLDQAFSGVPFPGDGNSLVAGFETIWQVTIGRDPSTALESIVFGPLRIRTRLVAAVAIGATTITTHEPLLPGSTVLGFGTGEETVTVTGAPSPIPGSGYPYVATLTAPTTKVQAVGAAVLGAGGTQKRLNWNMLSPGGLAMSLDSLLNLSGDLYRSSSKVVSTRRTGWTAATGTTTRTTFDTATVTTAQLAERLKALLDDLIAHGLIGT